MQVPVIDITAIYPEVIVALVGLLVLVIDLFIKPQRKGLLSVVALVGLFIALFPALLYWDRNDIVLGQERDGVQRNGRR